MYQVLAREYQPIPLSRARAYGPIDTSLPENTILPQVTPEIGPSPTRVFCQEGEWTGARVFSYQWYKNDTPIWGATANYYVAQDDGFRFKCLVTATNHLGSVSVFSQNDCLIWATAITEYTLLDRWGIPIQQRDDELIETRNLEFPDAVAFYNLVTDFGAIGNGVANDINAFRDFRAVARTHGNDHIVLTMPPGEYYIEDPDLYDEISYYMFSGVRHLSIVAYGATLKFNCGVNPTGAGFTFDGADTIYTNSVLTGATTATLKDSAEASKFDVGFWYALAAYELQGRYGYPPNHHFLQYVKVTDITGGVITFTPEAKDDYLDTFPKTKLAVGSPGDVAYDMGGPVAFFRISLPASHGYGGLYQQPNGWDLQLEVYGLTYYNVIPGHNGVQMYSAGRDIHYIDCAWRETTPIATVNGSIRYTRCNMPTPTIEYADIEIDKQCEYVEFKDCTIGSGVACQSSSIQQIVFDGTITPYLSGTPRNILIKGNSVISNLLIGARGYGCSETVVIEAPAIISGVSGIEYQQKPTSLFSNSAGTLTYLGQGTDEYPTAPPVPFYIPGSLLAITSAATGSGFFAGPTCTLTAVTAVTGIPDPYVLPQRPVLHTTLPSPLPSLGIYNPAYVTQHTCRDVSVEDGVTGCDDILAMARAPKNKPLWNYAYSQVRNDWTPHDSPPGTSGPYMMTVRGQLVYIKVNVIQPYTGPSVTSDFAITGQYGCPYYLPDGSDAGGAWYIIRLNAKIAGERVITPTTITGAQTGDTLGSPPGLIVIASGLSPCLNSIYAGVSDANKAIISVEVLCDQEWS